MFKQQKTILEASHALRGIFQKYEWKSSPENWLDIAEEQSRSFLVTLPFVGAFSAGKSTLINALIEQPLFSTNIDPETAYPAELTYGEDEKLSGHLPDGSEISLSSNDMQGNLSNLLPKGGAYVSATLPHPLLARLPHLRLVDMPGWDSGIEAHSNAIDSYAARSLAYCVVVSAEEGSLRESLRRALRELAIRDMPILAVITKADKKLPEEVDAVVEQVRQEITGTMGRAPFAIVKASARKKQFDELIDALVLLEQSTEQLFSRNVTEAMLSKLASFKAHLDTLINNDDLDSERIKAQCDRLSDDMERFETRLKDETAQLEAHVQPVLGRIVERTKNALLEDLESLIDTAMHGGDLSGSIGCIARLAAEEGVASEFNPEVERYLNRVIEGLPDEFSPQISSTFDFRAQPKGSEPPLVVTPIISLLMPLVKLHPQLRVISTIILGVVGLLESLFHSKKQEQADEARQRDSVKRTIVSQVVPDTVRQVREALQPMLEGHIQTAKQKIAETIRTQQESHIAALNELQAKLAAGQASFALARAQYQADKDAVSLIASQLEAA